MRASASCFDGAGDCRGLGDDLCSNRGWRGNRDGRKPQRRNAGQGALGPEGVTLDRRVVERLAAAEARARSGLGRGFESR